MAAGIWKMLSSPKLCCLLQRLTVRDAPGREGLRVHAGLVGVAGKWNHRCPGRRWCHGELHLSSSPGRRGVWQCSLSFPGAPASPSIHPSILLHLSVPPSLYSFLHPSLQTFIAPSLPLFFSPFLHPSIHPSTPLPPSSPQQHWERLVERGYFWERLPGNGCHHRLWWLFHRC